jgi:hypothetical protein
VIIGSPDEVAEQLREVAVDLNVGQLMLLLQFGNMSKQLTTYNTRLFAARVAPQLRDLFDDRWENRRWPTPDHRRPRVPGARGWRVLDVARGRRGADRSRAVGERTRVLEAGGAGEPDGLPRPASAGLPHWTPVHDRASRGNRRVIAPVAPGLSGRGWSRSARRHRRLELTAPLDLLDAVRRRRRRPRSGVSLGAMLARREVGGFCHAGRCGGHVLVSPSASSMSADADPANAVSPVRRTSLPALICADPATFAAHNPQRPRARISRSGVRSSLDARAQSRRRAASFRAAGDRRSRESASTGSPRPRSSSGAVTADRILPATIPRRLAAGNPRP